MRIATFNLMSGRSVDGVLEPARLAEAVRTLDADVLALQEVDRAQPRSEGRDLAAEVAEAAGASTYRYCPTVTGTPGGSWRPVDAPGEVPEGPSYGIALVSRRPVLAWQVVALRAAPVAGPVVVPGPRGRPAVVVVRDEPRAALVARIAGPAGEVLVAACHLSFIPGWNVRQARRVARAVAAMPAEHRLVAGDLNLPGRTARWATGWHRLAEVASWPVHAPRIQFDHVLADTRLPVATAAAVRLPVSDHRAVVVGLPQL